jgi:Derlin-2/3
MIVYVWARRNPHARMNFLGLFNFNAPYLPWVILLIEYLADPSGSIFDFLGIIVGHVYYFFVDIYPRTSGRHLLKTPGILKHLIDGPVVEPQVAGRAAQPAANVNNNNDNANNNVANNDVAAPVN